jgi:hypothetical protein
MSELENEKRKAGGGGAKKKRVKVDPPSGPDTVDFPELVKSLLTQAQHKRETGPRHIAGLHERLHPEEEQSTQSKKSSRRTLQRQKKRLVQERGEGRGAGEEAVAT